MDLFVTHIALLLRATPPHLQIQWDCSYQPFTSEEHARIKEWMYTPFYDDDDILFEPVPTPCVPSPPRHVFLGPLVHHDGWATADDPIEPLGWDLL